MIDYTLIRFFSITHALIASIHYLLYWEKVEYVREQYSIIVLTLHRFYIRRTKLGYTKLGPYTLTHS
jgi:hypothetical protein